MDDKGFKFTDSRLKRLVLSSAAGLIGVLLLAAIFGLINWPAAALLSVLVSAAVVSLGMSLAYEAEASASAALKKHGGLLTQPEAPLRAKIVEGVLHPLLLISESKDVLEANRAARDLFGQNIIDQRVALFLRNPEALDALDEVLKHGHPRALEISLKGVRPRVFKLNFTRVAAESDPKLRSNSRHQFYIVAFFQDISQIKATEKMRADFVANASHELRTPLTSLLGFIETLQTSAKDDPEAAERFLGIMQLEAERMVRLIDDLLSLSRIELQKLTPPNETLDVGNSLQTAANLMRSMAEKFNVTITLDITENLPMVKADQDQILQVLQNLISNAIKYGGKGGTVHVSAEQDDEVVRIGVSDNGPGIDAKHISRLTERFYRVEKARSRTMGSTGLGLSIVKNIIDRHLGGFEITSEPGEGSTFSFTLPLADSQK